ncbi:MAG: hypothetical protein JWO38_991, partial [Gemmataceae bacterium]|nr:hypothetical protein [Gemmataceae bacterium]
VALYQAVGANTFPDFFIYRAGAVIGLRGESPYDIPRIRALVADQYPDPDPTPDSFVNNCGYFLPPMAVLIYAPFAALPWAAAKVAWAVLTAAAALGIVRLPDLFRRPGERPAGPGLVWGQLVPFLLVVNFLALAVVQVGQTTLLAVGCVAFGQWCFERGRPLLGAVLWAVPFMKPHLALPLLPLAWYLGGWKRAGGVLGVVAGLNLVGASVVGGSPLFLHDYLEFLSAGHKAVAFNLAERNYEITSWNRLLFVATEGFAGTRFLVEQTAGTTLAGYLIWFGLVVGRCAAAGVRPSPAWAAAAAAVGAVWCPQVLGYEALFLAVAVPWVRELFDAGLRVRGWAAAFTLGAQLVPYQLAAAVGVDFHRPLGVAVLAVLVLAGPVAPRPRGSVLTRRP